MLVYGKNVAKEILNYSPSMVRKVIIQDNFQDKELISLIKKTNLPTKLGSREELEKLVKGLHQGIILDIMDYQYYGLDDVVNTSEFLIILDHLEDPHNFGAIVRTAEAAGVDAIIVPKNRETLVNATVMKTSAGSLVRSKIVKVSNINNTIDKLKKEGFWIIGTDMDGEDYREIDYDGKICLVIGNEGEGISRLVKSSCDFIASIPMYGEINSLNASVASGIIIYEVIRSRK